MGLYFHTFYNLQERNHFPLQEQMVVSRLDNLVMRVKRIWLCAHELVFVPQDPWQLAGLVAESGWRD